MAAADPNAAWLETPFKHNQYRPAPPPTPVGTSVVTGQYVNPGMASPLKLTWPTPAWGSQAGQAAMGVGSSPMTIGGSQAARSLAYGNPLPFTGVPPAGVSPAMGSQAARALAYGTPEA